MVITIALSPAVSISKASGFQQQTAVPSSSDKRLTIGDKAFSEAENLQTEWKVESLRKALKKYSEAQAYWHTTNNTVQQIQALKHIGDIYCTLSEFKQATAFYNQALQLSQVLQSDELDIELRNKLASAYIELADVEKALSYCNQACELSRKTGNRRGEAQALNHLGLIHFTSSEMMKALDCFNQALLIWQEVNESQGLAEALVNIGYTQGNLGETQQALNFYYKALAIWQTLNDWKGQARALTAIGGIYSWIGEKQKALNYHNQALKMFRVMGNRSGEAATLNGIGYIYDDLGDKSKALKCYILALRLYQDVGNQSYAAITMGYVGRIHQAFGDQNKALQFYTQKLAISRTVQDRWMEAYTLKDIGIVFDSLGDKEKALNYYNQALVLSQNVMDRRGQAYTLNNIGDIYDSWGQKQKALDYYKQALQLFQAATDRRGELLLLYNLAHSERDSGNLSEARTYMESSLNIIESLRTKVAGQHLRASYLASVYQHYEFYIDLLMRLHEQNPSKGYDILAFEVNEHARARTLLEILTEAHADIRQGVDPKLLEQERALQQKLNERAERQRRLLSGKYTPEEAVLAKTEVEDLLEQFEDIQAQVKEKSPRYAALTQPAKFAFSDLQKALDQDTVLLEYSLGSEHSQVWVVTQTSFKSFRLPKRSEIEEVARDLYNLIAADNPGEKRLAPEPRKQQPEKTSAQFSKTANKLSRILLEPLAASLNSKRLIIVADGALQYIPFSVLPEPGKTDTGIENWQPLVIEHEITCLPSLSTLITLREQLRGRPAASGVIAVLADPVYEKNDPRVTSMRSSLHEESDKESPRLTEKLSPGRELKNRPLPESLGREEGSGFHRLPFSWQEASAIMALVPKERSLQALGFDASRTLAMTDQLSQYRIVHFATHGSLNSTHPDLSGIVLSLMDRQGYPQDGVLRLNEIYNLNLPVDLVVLSACQTALGQNIRGEGLVSLTRGFMYAGAARVVASLWKINDRAAAELMKKFYSYLLGAQKLSPAAALRAAQIDMWKDGRWNFPYYWAAFVIQGEWR